MSNWFTIHTLLAVVVGILLATYVTQIPSTIRGVTG